MRTTKAQQSVEAETKDNSEPRIRRIHGTTHSGAQPSMFGPPTEHYVCHTYLLLLPKPTVPQWIIQCG